ncbi:MAG: L-glutamate gamma-semialdehyde dehydrogenase [Planctomycetota bacterium]|nr:MAG: L-glutamate gamma-semialdehyde dehydrogenase [Planctomycetota bacterium]
MHRTVARKATKSTLPSLDAETLRLGRELWDALDDRRPTIFDRRWWLDHLLEWAMADASVKVQMFRFVDVLPTLKSSESIARHLQEYFDEVNSHLPLAARLALEVADPDSLLGKALAVNARNNVRKMAERFIAGTTADEVYQSVHRLRRQGMAFTLDLLGEAVISEPEAEAYQQQYLDLIRNLSPQVEKWPDNDLLDRDEAGFIPRCQVSLKLSALYCQFKPIDPVRSAEAVKARLRPILTAARENDAYVHVDMEQSAYKGLTQQIFRDVLMEDEFRDWSDCGIVIQAYLTDAEADLLKFREWVAERGTPISIRLVKGAYWDYETIHARNRGWQTPAFTEKWQSDANFEKLSRTLLDEREWLRPQIGSHNLRSLAHALAYATHKNIPQHAWEIQMLYGMADDQAALFAEQGHRVRIYTPFGQLLPGMAYLVRRLLENSSNDSFLKHAYDRDLPIDELLRNPEEVGARITAERKAATVTVETAPMSVFQNEPPTDFSVPENREAMQAAIDHVAEELGGEYPLVINGKAVDTRARITSKNPSHKKQVVGTSASASADHADQAVQAARRAYRQWSRTPAQQRADYLEIIAAEMRNQRFDLAAWEVFECGKSWAEADGDIAEAIDFCMYYAHLMRELESPLPCDLPGEENAYFYRSRGVCVVIAPWNFPLAILCGMTVAALVSGNTVVMKPAEQSVVVAAKFMEILRDAGIPDGVVNYLPGIGEDVGPALVSHPEVDIIAFTGSQKVGLAINKLAAETDPRQQPSVKRVIAEMGGKNAIIVDEDADLDEAVTGVIHSAFSYSGQKCSACSRVVVHGSIYETFLTRLQQAVEALIVGPAEDPGTVIGPVIDEEAYKRINDFVALGLDEHRLIVNGDVKTLAKEGFFIAPHVFADVPADARIAQQEIFGPVLCVIRAKDFDEAIDIANQSDYALTAGVYSRSPKHLDIARRELEAGNLYLNRPITGALVQRQPFGGFKMSGIGTKAGGRDYLLQFLIPVNITENTMRRGFAPPEKGKK